MHAPTINQDYTNGRVVLRVVEIKRGHVGLADPRTLEVVPNHVSAWLPIDDFIGDWEPIDVNATNINQTADVVCLTLRWTVEDFGRDPVNGGFVGVLSYGGHLIGETEAYQTENEAAYVVARLAGRYALAVSALQQNDRNGCFLPSDSLAECGRPMSFTDAALAYCRTFDSE